MTDKTLTLLPVEEVSSWDAFVAAHPQGSVFHTKAMVSAIAHTPLYTPMAIAAVDPSGRVAGLLVAIKVSLAGVWPDNLSSRSVMLAEPIVVPGPRGDVVLQRLLAHHDECMRDHVVFTEIRPIHPNDHRRSTYQSAGYECIDYNNYELDLNQGADQIFQNMSRQRRTNIRTNERRGLAVREADLGNEICTFYQHLTASYHRSRVPLVDLQHFREVFARLPSSQFRLTIADFQGEPIGSACHLIFNGRVYWWQAGTQRIPGISVQASLVWDAIQWSIERGESVYDFAGAGWVNEEYGPGIFKSRFGGIHTNPGRYRKIYSKWRMKIAEAGYQIARPFLPAGQKSLTDQITPNDGRLSEQVATGDDKCLGKEKPKR